MCVLCVCVFFEVGMAHGQDLCWLVKCAYMLVANMSSHYTVLVIAK